MKDKIIITSTPTGKNNFYDEFLKDLAYKRHIDKLVRQRRNEEQFIQEFKICRNMNNEDVQYLSKLLPDYTCEWRKDGTHCYSEIGIDDDEKWEYIFLAIKKYFGDRFYEVFHQICTNHCKFTIYHD